MWRCRIKNCVKELAERLATRNVRIVWLDESILFYDEVFHTFPVCNVIWTLYSPDLPLAKVAIYVDRCQCLELNSVEGLLALRDRRKMFRILVEQGIPVPQHVECNRDDAEPAVEEFDDHIIVEGEKISKPFLEKPADADNHEVYIYYPRSAGGGKIKLDKNSAVFDERGRIRRNGSFLYEKFIPSEGFETRLFVLASVVNEKDTAYIYAEAKTSVPATANEDGKRVIRFGGGLGNSVLALAEEKLVCPKIAMAFGQTTFKVDILRSQTAESAENFFVYDVSVKGGALKNRGATYFDEVAHALYADMASRLSLRGFLLPSERRSSLATAPQMSDSPQEDSEDMVERQPAESSATGTGMTTSPYEELMCVWSLVRHGDRTPKRKLKLQFPCEDPFTAGWLLGWLQGGEIQETLKKFVQERRDSSKVAELRSTQQLQRLLHILKQFDKRKEVNSTENESDEKESSFWSTPPGPLDSLVRSAIGVLEFAFSATTENQQYPHAKVDVLANRIQVNLKWGGELSLVGKEQAFVLGERFRRDNFPFEDAAQLHATLRHDVKVYSSSEPRCRQTAGSFTKGFLSLTGPLPQIIVSFVRNDGLGRLTDAPFSQSPVYEEIKLSVMNLVQTPTDLVTMPDCYLRAAESLTGIEKEFGSVGDAVMNIIRKIEALIAALQRQVELQLSNMEASSLMALRWVDVLAELQKNHGAVSHCFDAAIYDVRHNAPFLKDDPDIMEILVAIKTVTGRMREFLSPYEFGRTSKEKATVAAHYVSPLIQKLRWDLRLASGLPLGDEKDALHKHNDLYGSPSGWRPIRTRLYFAHNSHMQTVVNVLRFGAEEFKKDVANCIRFPADLDVLGYCSYVTIKLFRSADTYVARFFLSEGVGLDNEQKDPIYIGEMPMMDLDDFLSKVIDFATEEKSKSKSRGEGSKLGSYR